MPAIFLMYKVKEELGFNQFLISSGITVFNITGSIHCEAGSVSTFALVKICRFSQDFAFSDSYSDISNNRIVLNNRTG